MTTSQNTSWNAEVYDRIGTPMRGWAQQVIDAVLEHFTGEVIRPYL